MLNLPLLILAHCLELVCSLACVLLTGTLLKNKNFYLFFQRQLYEHIEETWDFYESYPVVSLCFSFLLAPCFSMTFTKQRTVWVV